jgi:hypothetical protein
VIDKAFYMRLVGMGDCGIGMNYRHINFRRIAVATALAFTSLTVPAVAEPRAVIELFTSQGCSSCPAADKLLGELAQDPSLLTMSLAVDYWDYLGWKDTLALHGHTVRQRAYADARGDRAVYTPQVVINGVAHALGSDKAAIEKVIAETRSTASPLKVPVTVTVADGKVSVNVPASSGAAQSAEVWLCPITAKAPVMINRGENSGKTLTYNNVVRRWVKLGDWNGKAANFSISVADLPKGEYSLSDIDRVDVIVQAGVVDKPGLMLGAATTTLR